jgi:hypothetical protein
MTTVPLGGFYRGLRIAPVVFSATTEGGATSWVVPWDITEIVAKCWGAGGGAGVTNEGIGGNGGAGGFAQARIAVTPGETLTIFVPTGGTGSNTVRAGGGGGSFAGIFRSTTALLIGGGGAGGGAGRQSSGGAGGHGGAGGGTTGIKGGNGTGGLGANGGTQLAGGTGDGGNGEKWIGSDSYASVILGGRNGASALGADAGNGGASSSEGDRARGGGGGAGWYGGGGGGRGSDGSNSSGGGGGGGSSYTTGTETTNTQGSLITPPNQSDRNYIAGRGTGGTPSSTASIRKGGDGLVVILI